MMLLGLYLFFYLGLISSQTTVKNNDDFDDLSELTLEGLDENDPYWSEPLCVPHDSLLDLECFPNFGNGSISLPRHLTSPEHECNSESGKVCSAGDSFYGKKNLDSKEFSSNQDKKLLYGDDKKLYYGSDVEDSFCDKKIFGDAEDSFSFAGEVEDSCYDEKLFYEEKTSKIKDYDDLHANIIKKPRSKRSRALLPQTKSWNSKILLFPFTVSPKSAKRECKSTKRSSRSTARRCSHCQARETPQWRMGPKGPKTLCNACGLKYKIGMLVPEYRPVASPTFDGMKHSNFTRKIIQKQQIY